MCSQLRLKRPRTHQPKRGRAPSYDKSIQGHPRKKEGGEKGRERKREREREGEREREREREGREGRGKKGKWTGVPSYERSSRDTPGRGVNLSVAFRITQGRKGVKVSTGSNEP